MQTDNPSTEFSDRVVTLSDGRPGLRVTLRVETTVPHAESGPSLNGVEPSPTSPAIIDFVSSTEALDRYGEIIQPAGWRLDAYRRNPVFQNAHQYGDVLFTLGKSLVTEIREVAAPDGPPRPALFQRVEFAVEANPMARIAYGLYRGKFLNAVSVGFIPIRWENGGPEAGYRRKFLEQELLEVSAVAIPANPEALQLGLTAGAFASDDLRDLLELVAGQENFRSHEAGTATDTSALGRGADEAQWLRLAREFARVLTGTEAKR